MTGGKAPRNKGIKFEREVVNLFKLWSLRAKRAWGSDGRSMGMSENVDVVAHVLDDTDRHAQRYQLKHLKKLPALCNIPEGLSGMILKETGKKPVIVMPLHQYIAWGATLNYLITRDSMEARDAASSEALSESAPTDQMGSPS